MDFSDIFKLKPVIDYDISRNDKIAYVVELEKPVAYIKDEGRIDVEGYVDEVNWIDNKRLAITVDQKGGEVRQIWIRETDGKLEKLLADNNDNVSPFFINGPNKFLFISNRDGKTMHLYLYDNGEITKISDGELPVSDLCSNKRKVVYSQGIYDNDVIIFDLDKNLMEAKISFPNSEQHPASQECIQEDGSIIFLSNHEDFYNVGLWNRGEIEWLINTSHEKYEAISFNGDIFYVEDDDGTFKLRAKRSGKTIFEGGIINSLKTMNNYLYFIASTYNRSFDLYRFDGNKVERLTDSIEGIDTKELVRPSKVKYKSFDGVEITALLYSKGNNEDKGVIYIHGGPDWECTESLNLDIQFLVKAGFKVICPNYRGSTGYGRRFNHLNDKDLGGDDLRDVVEAIKVLNVKKVAVAGGSYGGYLTMMAVTKYPDLWCSAVAVVPFVNWFTEKQFERDVLKQYDEIKMGNDEALLRDRSPIFFVDRIKAPLLLLAGENDPRCPAEETLQVVEKLKESGRTVEYAIYKDEGHGFAKKENEVDSIKRLVDFISTQCK
ncbi:MAG: S9 family peptidase [Sulfolobaceae archaeon]|nr:S9 family peptidase [Sulfolobaceae archaeon]